ncbi:MAG: RNA polymerase sigma factor [Opitutaceae bacterium]
MVAFHPREVAAGTVPSGEVALAALVIRARAGDPLAQTELVRLYRRRLRGFLRGQVGDPWAAEDVLQQVWVKMVTQLHLLREVPRFETWLFTLARNCALDHRRRLRCRPAIPVEDGFWAGLTDPAAEDRVHEVREALEVALGRCAGRDRRLIEQVIAGVTYRVMADEAGLTLNALKVRLHRLRVQLRREVRTLCGSRADGASSR